MTSARVFYGLLVAIAATGVATTVAPAIEDLAVTVWLVAGALAALATVAKCVAAEVRWRREMDRVINAPATAMATDELVVR